MEVKVKVKKEIPYYIWRNIRWPWKLQVPGTHATTMASKAVPRDKFSQCLAACTWLSILLNIRIVALL